MDEIDELMIELFRDHEPPAGSSDAIRAVVQHLAMGTLDRDSFDSVIDEYDPSRRSIREECLDLILHVLRAALADHKVTTKEEALLRRLTRVFRVEEGDFYRRRRSPTAEILRMQLRRTLLDGQVDAAEEAHLSELQWILGLGYDQYLELIENVLTPLVDEWIASVTSDGRLQVDVGEVARKLGLLGAFYQLNARQRRALGVA